MVSVLIVEDDETAASELARMLSACPRACECSVSIALIGSYTASDFERDGFPDIAFVDIDLGEGRGDGIELVRDFFPSGCGTKIIYTTGYIEYCEDVYCTEHVSFLVKPITKEKLEAAMERALNEVDQGKSEVVAIRVGSAMRVLRLSDIVFVESQRRKLYLHLTREQIETYGTLAGLAGKLGPSFIRCHKSFCVNMEHIRELLGDGVRTDTSEWVPVSRRCRTEVRDAFARYLSSTGNLADQATC